MGVLGARAPSVQCYEGTEPPENCVKEHFLVINMKETLDNNATLTLLLYVFISVLFVWIAFAFVIFSKIYYIIYSYKVH